MCGDREVQDATPLGCQHHKHVQDLEPDRRHHAEVHRNQCLQVIVEERPPGWRGWLSEPDHVLADASLPDVDAKLQEFAVNMGRALRVEENAIGCRLSL